MTGWVLGTCKDIVKKPGMQINAPAPFPETGYSLYTIFQPFFLRGSL
jgi:hypothetical protein